MREPFTLEMMTEKALLWRCLHGWPLTAGSVDSRGPDGHIPYEAFRARNLRFLENLVKTYGACDVVARQGEGIAGHLRFYPKAVRKLASPGLGLCL